MNRFEPQYLGMLIEVFRTGQMRPSRVGNTCQIFGATLPIMDLRTGMFPILTTRRMYPAGIWGELAAFLRGATKLQEFKDFGCNYWDDNAAKWAPNEGVPVEEQSVGRIYGAQWRKFGERGVDQLDELRDGLVRDPYGRRHLLTTYDPSDMVNGCLPPCHLLTQFNVNNYGQLDACVYMRSVDLCLGLPADVVLYATLLLLIAQETGYRPGRLAFMMGDAHIYAVHSDAMQEQVARELYTPPTYVLDRSATVDNFVPAHIELSGYKYHDPIKYQLLT